MAAIVANREGCMGALRRGVLLSNLSDYPCGGTSMSETPRPVIETRFDQIFPVRDPREIERLPRCAEPRSYAASARLIATGDVSPGMFILLSGEVAITQHNALGREEPIVTHGPGNFIGELNQLSGRPSLVDA